MSIINDYLAYISTANYGSDVREAIVSSIRECYKDATGHPDSVAALVQEYIDREESIDDKVSLLTGLYNSLGEIVYSYDYNNGVSGIHIAEGEFGCVDQITLGPGKWMIKVISWFAIISNASPDVGIIYLSFSNTLDSDGFPIPLNNTYNYKDDLYYGTILNSSGSHTHFVKMIELTEERTIYMWIKHTGRLSSDIVVSPHMTAMKIGESTPSDGTSLVDQVTENTEDIAVLEGKVATNISDISTLDSDVSTLQDDVNDIEDDIADVKSDLYGYATLVTFTTSTNNYEVVVSIPKGFKVLCKYRNKSANDGYARVRFWNGAELINVNTSVLVTANSMAYSNVQILDGDIDKITFLNNNTREFEVTLLIGYSSFFDTIKMSLGHDIFNGLTYLQTVKLPSNRYVSTPLAITQGKKYLIIMQDYTGPSSGVIFRAYTSNNTHSPTLTIYKALSFVWVADQDYTGFYSAGCTYSVFEIKDESVVNALNPFEYTVGSNGDFPNFKDAVLFAWNTWKCVLKLAPEIFDITSEVNIENQGSGLPLGKGVHIIGQEGTVIRCNYTGTSGATQRDFSVFSGNPTDYTIENVRIEATNVRYCVHDECSGTDTPYIHKYINCEMYHDSSSALWRTPQCIGGGFGENGLCVIDGGIYESVPTNYSTTNDIGGPYSSSTSSITISWHKNNSDADATNKLIIKDVYLIGSDSNIAYGTGVNGKAIIKGCSYGNAPSAYAGDNVAYIYGNEIRA